MVLSAGPSRSAPNLKPRLTAITVVVLGLMALLFFRLWDLQLIRGKKFERLAESNRVRVVPMRSPRGLIMDRNGRELAGNRPIFNFLLVPEDVPDMPSLLEYLRKSVEFDEQKVLQRVRAANRHKPVLVKKDVTRAEVAFLEEHRLDIPGLVLGVEPARYYKYGKLAAHLIGYIGEVSERQLQSPENSTLQPGDFIGQAGVEKTFETYLRGREGKRYVEVDAFGRELQVLRTLPPEKGNDLVLTVDVDLQRHAEELLGERAGAVIALVPDTGEILAMASKAAFDPNQFARGISSEEWRALSNDPLNPLHDRAIQGQYPPGSVFKILMATAGLEEGVITPETTIFCPGYLYYGRRRYDCWKKSGHGLVNLKRALTVSCDVYFYKLGIVLGIDRIARYARGYGLGHATGLLLANEKVGLVPSREWKREVKGKPWYPGETVSVAIGQGYNLVTPIQLAMVISSVANGGTRYRPYVVKQIVDREGKVLQEFEPKVVGRLPARPETLTVIRNALRAVVNDVDGTGKKARLDGITVAGKTGTAQVVKSEITQGEEVPRKYRDHAWFVAFAPFEHPQIAVVVFIEHAGKGGSQFAYIAARLIERYLTNLPTS